MTPDQVNSLIVLAVAIVLTVGGYLVTVFRVRGETEKQRQENVLARENLDSKRREMEIASEQQQIENMKAVRDVMTSTLAQNQRLQDDLERLRQAHAQITATVNSANEKLDAVEKQYANQVRNLTEQLEKARTEVGGLNKRIEERDEQSKLNQSRIELLDLKVKELTGRLSLVESEKTALELKLAEREATLKVRDGEISDQKDLITRLQSEMEDMKKRLSRVETKTDTGTLNPANLPKEEGKTA